MKNEKIFINLTNGVQAIEDYELENYSFIRIQSTACEQKLWEDIIMFLSDDFMVCAALGMRCVVFDYGANKDIPRPIWQGLEWVKYVLSKRWYGIDYQPKGRAKTMGGYFAEQYCKLGKRTKVRIDYFAKYIKDPLDIVSVTSATTMDGSTEYYKRILMQ